MSDKKPMPVLESGVPRCSPKCPLWDGKRCEATGFRPESICEPAVVSMSAENERLWDALTQRRAELIYKKNRGGLSDDESQEFARLQQLSGEVTREAFPAGRDPLEALTGTAATTPPAPNPDDKRASGVSAKGIQLYRMYEQRFGRKPAE